MSVTLSEFAKNLNVETAFTVLAVAKALKAKGKDVVELEIGDSPFESTASAKAAGEQAIQRQPVALLSVARPARVSRGRGGLRAQGIRHSGRARRTSIVGPGAKIFQQFFCEAFLNPGDGALVFSPHFPTFLPNIERRQARAVLAPLSQKNEFRPDVDRIERFLAEDPSPKAIFLNSPHNPTGGVATEDDLKAIADVVRGKNVAVFSDEPYCHMVWKGRHRSLLEQPGMLDHARRGLHVQQVVQHERLAAGVRGVGGADRGRDRQDDQHVPVLRAADRPARGPGGAAEGHDRARPRHAALPREGRAAHDRAQRIEGIHSLDPTATFYVFPNVAPICNRLGITSHGLALYLLEGADDTFGVACLGGECFGEAGAGFLRFSCAEPNERLQQALDFLPVALSRTDRVKAYLASHPQFRLAKPY